MHRHIRHALPSGQFQHREDVLLVAVHPTRRQQAEHMQGTVLRLGRRAGRQQLRIGEEAAIADGRVDPGQVLVDDAAGAQVHVAHFRVAHLPIRQADMAAFGMDQRMRQVASN